jgi:hypothetical protein
MKILINESRLETLAKNYMKSRLGKYTPTDKLTQWDGFFYSDGEVVAKTSDEQHLYLLESLFETCKSMFGLSTVAARNLFLEVAHDISGVKYKTLYLMAP